MRSRSSFAGRIGCAPNGDDGVHQLFYDGKTLVLYSPANKEYLSIPVPDIIEGALKEATKRIGVDFPLAAITLSPLLLMDQLQRRKPRPYRVAISPCQKDLIYSATRAPDGRICRGRQLRFSRGR